MTDAAANHPTPPLIRISASQVPQLMGLSYNRSTYDILRVLRTRMKGEIAEEKPSMVSSEDYWALVGLVRDNYTQTHSQHITMIKEYLNRDEPDYWYTKLHGVIWRAVGSTIHEDLLAPQIKSFEVYLTPNVVLSGRPDEIDEKGQTIVELKTRKKDEFLESDTVQLYCYMKLTGYKNGILRVKTPDMVVERMHKWDEEYWKKIERTMLTILEWV